MERFAKFKEMLKKSVRLLKGKADPALELMTAVDAADNWESLERLLMEQRTVCRIRQQGILDRLEPLSERVAALLDQAKNERIKVKKQNLLRQAEDYLRELEAEDEPAKIYGSNSQMLTGVIMQVRKARAMEERGVEAEALDAIATNLEEIAVAFGEALEAAEGIAEACAVSTEVPAAMDLENRLSAIYEADSGASAAAKTGDSEKHVSNLERQFYAGGE